MSNNLRRELIKVEKNLRRSHRKSLAMTRTSPLIIVFVFESGGKTDRELQLEIQLYSD